MSQSDIIKIFFSICFLIILVVLNIVGVVQPLLDIGRITISTTKAPVEYSFRKINSFFQSFINIKKLVEENKNLKDQIAILHLQIAQNESALADNIILRQALGYKAKNLFNLLPAEILSYDYFSSDREAIINRGSSNGIVKGNNVIVSEGVLVGVVTEVFINSSKIEFITSSNIAVNARTTNGFASGIVRGEHGLGLIFDQISLNEEIKNDDYVITSGSGDKFIKDLLIGRVNDVGLSTNNLFKTANIVPIANFRNLKTIFIILNEKQNI